MQGFEILAVRNVMRVVNELTDIRTLFNPLTWVNRIPSVEASDGEITARFLGRVVVADIINNDQRAVVRSGEPIRFQDHSIPKIKHGENITENQMEVLLRIANNQANLRDLDIFRNYITRRIGFLIDGVRIRKETLLMGMLLDSFSYSNRGVQIEGSWGTPSDAKVVVSVPWSDHTNSTPVTDVTNFLRYIKNKYGVIFNRISLADAVWMDMVMSDEFQKMAQLFSAINFPANTFPTGNDVLMRELAARIFRDANGGPLTFETNDNTIWQENADGSRTNVRLQPTDTMIFTSTQFDNNATVWDWANGMVFETMRGVVPSIIGGFGGPQSGPVGYVTGADSQGNPPGWTMWAVQRGFPRKHFEVASGTMKVY